MKQNLDFDFGDEIVLVTGAGQGIGEATSRAFAKAKADLILVDVNKENIVKLKEELEYEEGVSVLALDGDISSQKMVRAMVEKSIETFGKIDILFNNAGITGHYPLRDVTYEQWRRIMSVNLDGTFLVAREVGVNMISNGGGKIINTASMSGYIVNKKRYNGVYCISKAAIVMMTKALAVEWAEFNVNVNAIAPGTTKTPLIKAILEDPQRLKELEEQTPMNRLAEMHEIANTVLFLASAEAGYITGETVLIDGGYTIW